MNKSEKIGVAADHGGYNLKEFLKEKLIESGYQVSDYGNQLLDNDDDFPDYVIPLSRDVSEGKIQRGIAVCGSGVGACVAANKIKGVRASLITDNFSAHQGVEDDNMNIICLGGRVTGNNLALEIVNSFLDADYIAAERHIRRLEKISSLES
jgi:ribose 5-phosphate isomerase B